MSPSSDAEETWERLGLGETPLSRMFQVAVDPADRLTFTAATSAETSTVAMTAGILGAKDRFGGDFPSRHVYPMACGRMWEQSAISTQLSALSYRSLINSTPLSTDPGAGMGLID